MDERTPVIEQRIQQVQLRIIDNSLNRSIEALR